MRSQKTQETQTNKPSINSTLLIWMYTDSTREMCQTAKKPQIQNKQTSKKTWDGLVLLTSHREIQSFLNLRKRHLPHSA